MSVAFRIRTSAGQELSFASRASFEDFVRSGDLSPDDLVYDGETGSWSPSRTHPIVLEIEYETDTDEEGVEGSTTLPTDKDRDSEPAADALEATEADGRDEDTGDQDTGDQDTGDEGPADEDTGDDPAKIGDDSGTEGASDLGLSLAPVTETAPQEPEESVVDSGVPEIERQAARAEKAPAAEGGDGLDLDLAPEPDVSPERASEAFVEKMENERASELDFGGGSSAGGAVRMENRGSMGGMITPASDRTAPREERRPQRRREGRGPAADAPVRRAPAPAPKKSRLGLVAAVVVVAAGSYIGYTMFQEEPQPVPPANQPVDPIVVPPTPTPDPTPAISRTEVDVRDRARERFLTASQLLIRDLPSVPGEWATTEYFVRPSEHDDVVPVWESYLVAIRTVRAQDRDRYATAYNGAMNDARIEGEERAERLQAALAGFDSVAARREAHYDRVEALASAAIQSHGVLVEAEGLLLTDATAEGGPGGLGAGISGRDADAQLLFDQVIEVLAARLSANGLGPRTGENVREWIWDGFLGAVMTPG